MSDNAKTVLFAGFMLAVGMGFGFARTVVEFLWVLSAAFWCFLWKCKDDLR